MSNVSTFGTFGIARLGIYVSQKALNITGNNITNINTEGYSRQKLDIKSLYLNGADRYSTPSDTRIGSGAYGKNTSQLRDPYLDIRYRNENANVGAYEAKLSGLEQIAILVDEVCKGDEQGGVIEAQFNDLISQVERLNSEGAGQDNYDTLVRSSCESLVSLFHNYADEMETVYQNQVLEFKDNLDTVNGILKSIQELNSSIRKSEIHGAPALEQKDERNLLIDELSKYLRINVTYEEETIGGSLKLDKLVIKLQGNEAPYTDEGGNSVDHTKYNDTTLINGIYATRLSIRQVQAKDENGTPLFETDPQGKPVLDKDGNPIATMVDSSNFDIDLAPLTDLKGNIKTVTTVDDVPAKLTWEIKSQEDADGALDTYLAKNKLKNPNKEDVINTAGDVVGTKTTTYAAVKDTTDGKWYVQQTVTETDQDGAVTNGPTTGFVQEDGKNVALAITAVDATEEQANQALDKAVADGVLPALKENQRYRMARKNGEWVVQTETITPDEKKELFDNTLYGALQAQRELLTEQGEYSTAEQRKNDPNASTKRGIPYYQKVMDTLANQFAHTMNEANRPYAAPGTTPDPNDGTFNGRPLGKGDILFSNSGNGNDTKGITASNISISYDWSHDVARILQSKEPGFKDNLSTDNSNLSHILVLLKGEHDFKPNGYDLNFDIPKNHDVKFFSGSFQELFTNHVGSTLGSEEKTTTAILKNYSTQLDELYVARDAVSGVDLNDETMNMIQYQKSYAAACRLFTTIDQMLEKLINGT